MNRFLKGQKGISLIAVIIIVVIVIAGIIFVVEMSKPRDGIGSVKEETQEWEKSKEEKNKALQELERIEKK